eukprot:6666445-Prymnesium_polylepis.1
MTRFRRRWPLSWASASRTTMQTCLPRTVWIPAARHMRSPSAPPDRPPSRHPRDSLSPRPTCLASTDVAQRRRPDAAATAPAVAGCAGGQWLCATKLSELSVPVDGSMGKGPAVDATRSRQQLRRERGVEGATAAVWPRSDERCGAAEAEAVLRAATAPVADARNCSHRVASRVHLAPYLWQAGKDGQGGPLRGGGTRVLRSNSYPQLIRDGRWPKPPEGDWFFLAPLRRPGRRIFFNTLGSRGGFGDPRGVRDESRIQDERKDRVFQTNTSRVTTPPGWTLRPSVPVVSRIAFGEACERIGPSIAMGIAMGIGHACVCASRRLRLAPGDRGGMNEAERRRRREAEEEARERQAKALATAIAHGTCSGEPQQPVGAQI